VAPFPVLLLLFLLVPLVEVYVLIAVGGWIGALPTVFLVVFTAVLGAVLLRHQGLATLQRVQMTIAQGGIPAVEMLEGAILLLGGALLLTPGFITDTLGFACLIPAIRRRVAGWALRHFIVGAPGGDFAAGRARSPDVIEGEFHREED
jgi:UPF0716 protein FxsA